MPMSAAALTGIEANGLAWKKRIRLEGLPEQLGNADMSPEQIGAIRDRIVHLARSWAQANGIFSQASRDIEAACDDLEASDENLIDVRGFLGQLYDQFDFHRILVD